jgi:thiol-disulfide isomerase/thioredoxin
MKKLMFLSLMALGLAGTLLIGAAQLQTAPKGAAKVSASEGSGKAAPNFSYIDIKGNKLSLASLKGKVTIVDQWATWCGPCKKEIPAFASLKKEFGNNLEIIGVSYDDDQVTVEEFLKNNPVGQQINYSVVFGTGKKDAFGEPEALPTTYFIDKQGRVRKQEVGAISAENIKKLVKQLLAE